MSSKVRFIVSENSLILRLEDDQKIKNIDINQESLSSVIFRVAKELNLTDLYPTLDQLFKFAREAADILIDPYIDIDDSTDNFNLFDSIRPFLEELKSENQKLNSQNLDLDIKVSEFLSLSRIQDIFASILELIYSVIIAKVFIVISDLGLDTIVLDDSLGDIRLRDRFRIDCQKMGIKLELV